MFSVGNWIQHKNNLKHTISKFAKMEGNYSIYANLKVGKAICRTHGSCYPVTFSLTCEEVLKLPSFHLFIL